MKAKPVKRVPMRFIQVTDDPNWRNGWSTAFYVDYLAEMERDLLATIQRQRGMVSAQQSEELEWLRGVIPELDQNWTDNIACAGYDHLDA